MHGSALKAQRAVSALRPGLCRSNCWREKWPRRRISARRSPRRRRHTRRLSSVHKRRCKRSGSAAGCAARSLSSSARSLPQMSSRRLPPVRPPARCTAASLAVRTKRSLTAWVPVQGRYSASSRSVRRGTKASLCCRPRGRRRQTTTFTRTWGFHGQRASCALSLPIWWLPSCLSQRWLPSAASRPTRRRLWCASAPAANPLCRVGG